MRKQVEIENVVNTAEQIAMKSMVPAPILQAHESAKAKVLHEIHWYDALVLLTPDTVNLVTEGIGPDAFTHDEISTGAHDQYCMNIANALAADDEAEIGRLVKSRLKPYLLNALKNRGVEAGFIKCLEAES